jgi:hypothetical protein
LRCWDRCFVVPCFRSRCLTDRSLRRFCAEEVTHGRVLNGLPRADHDTSREARIRSSHRPRSFRCSTIW